MSISSRWLRNCLQDSTPFRKFLLRNLISFSYFNTLRLWSLCWTKLWKKSSSAWQSTTKWWGWVKSVTMSFSYDLSYWCHETGFQFLSDEIKFKAYCRRWFLLRDSSTVSEVWHKTTWGRRRKQSIAGRRRKAPKDKFWTLRRTGDSSESTQTHPGNFHCCAALWRWSNHKLNAVWTLYYCLQELKKTLNTTKAGMQLLQMKYQEDFFHLGVNSDHVLSMSLFRPQCTISGNIMRHFFWFLSHRQAFKWFSLCGYGIQKGSGRKSQIVQSSAGPKR